MFSWPRLRDADPLLRCEMASTGEVRPFFFNIAIQNSCKCNKAAFEYQINGQRLIQILTVCWHSILFQCVIAKSLSFIGLSFLI